ncbi:hypothetical protein P7C73_g156, partial [Tremellales sp. Uapishka_1]
MSKTVLLFVILTLVALSFAPKVAAFGAGNIPSYSYLEEKAFRHGDIEDILSTMLKAAGGSFLSRGSKFNTLDVKRVYFGNWLRDYSQAVDVGALKKTNLATILNICMVLGFLAHGYATQEFEVTRERLGCYLPTEHIDNPKGYAEGEDARQYDSRLRGPVDPRELEVDPRTGMKNYIANENGSWDTSKALVRRTLQHCIQMGRKYRQTGNKEDEYEAFRLLGQSLHTLEDFSAHSNWCELALISFGYSNVFPHVGQNVRIRAPNGKSVPILVTGTFGGADFIHSLLGETTDHLSEASVSDLTKSMANARSVQEGQTNSSNTLRQLFLDLPGGGGDDLTRGMNDVTGMRAGQPGGIDPSQMTPQELHDTLWKILSFRDTVIKKISMTIDKIPGLGPLVEKIQNSVSVFIITTLEPFVKPILGQATAALGQSSQAVIDSQDQYEVWNDMNASDPTHSYLSKDHFGLMLNQPAGEVAQVVVEHAVTLVVKAWDNPNMRTEEVTEDVLQCLFHPDWFDSHSNIQTKMMNKMRQWIDTRGQHKQETINRLTSESVRAGKNRRIGDQSQDHGHVHNALLPQGGLQQVLQQHNVHVPGAPVLNAGQDLIGGKMPWQQGFGTGGPNAWRDLNTNDAVPTAQQYGQDPYPLQVGNQSQSQYPQYPQQDYQPEQQSFQSPQQHYQTPQQPYLPPQPSYSPQPPYGGSSQPYEGQQPYGTQPMYGGNPPFGAVPGSYAPPQQYGGNEGYPGQNYGPGSQIFNPVYNPPRPQEPYGGPGYGPLPVDTQWGNVPPAGQIDEDWNQPRHHGHPRHQCVSCQQQPHGHGHEHGHHGGHHGGNGGGGYGGGY